KVSAVDFATAEIRLPSSGKRPLASNPVIEERAGGDLGVKLANWQVTTAALAPAVAIDLLCNCAGRELLAPGIIAGADLLYWAAAMRFAGALAARHQFLPDLVQENDGFHARWRAAYPGRDDERRIALAGAMPSAVRALTPEIPTELLLREFLDVLIDELVRSSSPEKRSSGDGVHDRWLNALHSRDGRLAGEFGELQALEQQIREWQRPLSISSNAPYRLCFRLEEPEANNGADSWHVQYLMQARNDPSLLIPASNVWNGKPAKRSRSLIWNHAGFDPREHLLFSLGQASCMSPDIEQSLKSPVPSGYEM